MDRETGAPIPLLATDWIVSPDRLQYTFILRRGVKFHDGTDFDAQAVVTNFEHWVALPTDVRANSDQGFTQVFRHNDAAAHTAQDPSRNPSRIRRRQREREHPSTRKQVAHHAAEASATGHRCANSSRTIPFVGASTRGHRQLLRIHQGRGHPHRGAHIAPAHHRTHRGADAARPGHGLPQGAGRRAATSGGTGFPPFPPTRWAPARTTSCPGTTGSSRCAASPSTGTPRPSRPTPPPPTVVVFHEIRTPSGRLGALDREEIDGFDMVTVTGLRELVREGKLIVQRDPYSVTYLGMNRSTSGWPRTSSAGPIAHGIDRQKIIEQFYISGTKEARGFLPASLGIKPSDTYYGPDPNARQGPARILRLRRHPHPVPVPAEHLPGLPAAARAHLCRDLTAARLGRHQSLARFPWTGPTGTWPRYARGRAPGCTCWASTAATGIPTTSWARCSLPTAGNSTTTRRSSPPRCCWPAPCRPGRNASPHTKALSNTLATRPAGIAAGLPDLRTGFQRLREELPFLPGAGRSLLRCETDHLIPRLSRLQFLGRHRIKLTLPRV